MKILAVVLLSVILVSATKIPLRDGITPQILGPVELIPEPVAEQIPWASLKNYVLDNGEAHEGYVEANVTSFFLSLVGNIHSFLIAKGYDPMKLSDQNAGLSPIGTVTLNNGYISGISTLTAAGSVLAKYTYSSKVLELVVPVSFDKLVIKYDYVTKITLLKISGNLEATVNNFIINLRAGFSFKNYHAFVDEADVKDAGRIDFKIHGTGVTDTIINTLSKVLIDLFHGILLKVVDVVIQKPIKSAVDDVNKLIDNILKPNSTLV